jgi:hypothetical protein
LYWFLADTACLLLFTEKVLGTRRFDCRSVSLCDSQTHQVGTWKGPLFVLF